MHRFMYIKKVSTPPPPPPTFDLQHMYSNQASAPGGLSPKLSTATFSGVAIGANDATRELFVVMTGRKSGGSTGNMFSSVTIAGNNCAMLNGFRDVTGGFDTCHSAARLTNPGSMTTADIVVNLTGAYGLSIIVSVYRATNRVLFNSGVTDFQTMFGSNSSSHILSGITQPSGGFTLFSSIYNTDFSDTISVSPGGWSRDGQVPASNVGNSTALFASNKGGGLSSITTTLSGPNRLQKAVAWSFYG